MVKPLLTNAPVKKGMQPLSLFRGTELSLWDFFRDGVTSSFLNSFMTCREQTRLSYVQGWGSRRVPLAFEFGTCVHWILEQIYGEPAASWEDTKDIVALIDDYQFRWRKEVKMPSKHQLDQQELVYGMAEVVLPFYLQRWAGDFDGKKRYPSDPEPPAEWLSLEEDFMVPFTFPDGKVVPIRGKRDGVFKTKKGRVKVFDTKCRSIINDDDILDTMPLDLQQMLYLWATQTEMKAPPAGMILNVVRRPGHRRGKEETLADFLERMRQDVSKKARWDHFFVRYEMAITPGEINSWYKDVLTPILHDVRGWWEGRHPHYANHSALVTKYGRCQLFQPIVKNDYTDCYRRDRAFSELGEF